MPVKQGTDGKVGRSEVGRVGGCKSICRAL